MIRVLVVEDNGLHLAMVTRRLTMDGFQVIAATNGAQAVALARAERPDVILLDMDLPILPGWETAGRIRAITETRGIPIIAVTADPDVHAERRCIAAGCDEYEPKPIDFARLQVKMRLLIGLRGSDQLRERQLS